MKYKVLLSVVVLSLCLPHVHAKQLTVLHQSKNTFGPMWVYEVDNVRCLSFLPPENREDEQTCIYYDNPQIVVYDYCKMILGALYINTKPKRVLLIGLGGGTIATAIHKLIPSADIDIVEINRDMLYVARKFFFFNPTQNIHVCIEDGSDFIRKAAPNSYDLIILDAFNKDYVPESFLTDDFVMDVKKCLKQHGIVAVNTYNDGLQKYNNVSKKEARLYSSIFSDLFELKSPPSTVILAQKGGSLPSKDRIKKAASNWSNSFRLIGIDSMWLADKFNRQ